ncbi:MAG: NADPH-dependent 7-cyano-7-deazaguanine reductase QueF [Ketobacteraceae bacterium]|nr:NADPH-dependent 7-cyano-7-deazaguanine reductase QueF [Ketobacteraceae bacterium]
MKKTPEQYGVLGKETAYPQQYDPGLLCPISRIEGRRWISESLTDQDVLPFKGVDYWNAYEFSWLETTGKPHVGVLELTVPHDSPNIVESKSLKLYLNSLNHEPFAQVADVVNRVSADLENVMGVPVDVKLHTDMDHEDHYAVSVLKGQLIDTETVTIENYAVEKAVLRCASSAVVTETLYSHLLRSNCPVTGQPDWASVQIRYHGPRIDRSSLLKYIVSYRNHNEFHEQCVERMFMDIREQCGTEKLTVYARYTRRGGIDINPFRSDFELPYPNGRLLRQ